MQVRLLGPVSARHEGTDLALGGLKQRAVFASLALNPNRVVSMDRLIDEVWPDEPPAQATVALRSYVSRLRRVLLGTGGMIETRPPGWVLRVAVEQIDAVRFAQLVQDGRTLAEQGDQPERVRACFAEAVDLWTGDPLADLTVLEFARVEAVRLVDLHREAGELLLEARLAAGDEAGVVDAARQFVRAHPYRERGWAALLLALYRNGQQSDAVAAFEQLRRLLRDELGLDPAPQVRDLAARILRQDPDLQPTPRSTSPAPAPVVVSAEDAPVLVESEDRLEGRAEALAQLDEAWQQARTGTGRLLLVEASAGAGKSAVLQALATRVRASGGRVLQGNGVGDDAIPALWPWVSIIRQLLAEVPDVASGASSAPAALAVATLGAGTGPHPAEDAQLAQTTLYRGVVDLLFAARQVQPLAVVIDDLQWVDRDSLTLLALVVDQLASAGVLFAVAVRSDEANSAAVVRSIDTLHRDRVSRVELPPLDPADVAALARRLAGRPVEPGLAAAITDRTSGNPLFVTELVRLLVAEGQLSEQAARRALPSGVRDVLQRRIDRLPKETVHLLGIAALVGSGVLDVDLLAAVTGLGEDDVLDGCEAGLLTGLLVENGNLGTVGLSHDLVRQTLIAGLSEARRVRWHAKIAAALQQRSATSPEQMVEIAHQLTLAAPAVGAAAAIPYLISASEDALSRYAHGSAEATLQSALTMAGTIVDPVQRHLMQVQVQGLLAGLQTLARPSLGRSSAPDAPPQLTRPTDARSAAGWLGTVTSTTTHGHYDWARAAARDVLVDSPSRHAEIAARFTLGWVEYVLGDLTASTQHLAVLAEMIEGGIDIALPGALSHLAENVAGYRALIAHARGDDAAASAMVEAARGRARGQSELLDIELYASILAALRGDRGAAAAHAAECERISQLTEYPVYAIVTAVVAGWSHSLSTGSPDAVDRAYARYASTGIRSHRVIFLLLRAEVHAAVADHAGATELVRQSRRAEAEFGEVCGSPRLTALATRLLPVADAGRRS